jgi:hypothetical protein
LIQPNCWDGDHTHLSVFGAKPYNPDRRLSDLYELIILVLENSTAIKVRTLAKVSGKIIAMSPALGFATQVMTRCTKPYNSMSFLTISEC